MSPIRAVLAFLLVAAAVAGCATPGRQAAGVGRVRGDAVGLLGEVHDNAAPQRHRLEVLRRAVAAGWRPAIAMEQLDRERQADVERARRERPGDAQHVIDLAAPARGAGGWNWEHYRPFVDLALRQDLPLIAANLSNADTAKIARGGYAAVFAPAEIAALGLDRPVDAAWQAAQEREIDAGHCGVLPKEVWPRMARSQFARDAVMAGALRGHGRGVVLLAGNGHVRKDVGVPRWLAIEPGRVLAVGYLEASGDAAALPASDAFDAVVTTPPAERGDPCAAFTAPAAAPRRSP
jgi:uncharacterized iron-regulated protein